MVALTAIGFGAYRGLSGELPLGTGWLVGVLAGWYVYGDYCGGQVWAVAAGASRPAKPVTLLSTGRAISGFGEDDAGELYLCDLGGAVYRIAAR